MANGYFRNFKYSLPAMGGLRENAFGQKVVPATPTITTISSEQAAWPASNILLDYLPRRPAKSIGTGAYSLIFTFDQATPIECVLLNRVNYPYARLIVDGTEFGSITAPDYYTYGANGFTIPFDPDVGRRKLLWQLPAATTPLTIELQVDAGVTTDDGASYYSTGGITIGTKLVQFPDLMQTPFKVSIPQPSTIREFPSGGKQVNQLGDKRAILEFGGNFIDANARAASQDIDAIGMTPMILYPNMRMGDAVAGEENPESAYLVRRLGDPSRNYPNLPDLYDAGWSFEEVI